MAHRIVAITKLDLNKLKCLLEINKNKDPNLDKYTDHLYEIIKKAFINPEINGVELIIDNTKEFKLLINNFKMNEKCNTCKHNLFCKLFLHFDKKLNY